MRGLLDIRADSMCGMQMACQTQMSCMLNGCYQVQSTHLHLPAAATNTALHDVLSTAERAHAKSSKSGITVVTGGEPWAARRG